MVVPHTSRDEILKKLRKKVEDRLPIFIASAGSGLVAQLLEEAGVDCVNTFSGARLRANGMGRSLIPIDRRLITRVRILCLL